MPIRTFAYTVEVGDRQDLEIAAGEDRQYDLTFTSAALPVDFTGAQTITLQARVLGKLQVLQREHGGFVGTPADGTPYFVLTAADTAVVGIGVYDVDVVWVDSRGFKTQLLAVSRWSVLRS